MIIFGNYVRNARTALKTDQNKSMSLRSFASLVGLEPSYLSKIERGLEAPPSEVTISKIAEALGEDVDILLALAGKVSSELQAIICKRPKLFSSLLRQLKTMPDHAILRIARDVSDGDWSK